ncbi:MAG: hypothetical protein KGJ06_00870 [Pseudomonadota bacterium]|nr:hypothetical protein [Pseudomonadota bacterium]
MAARKRLIVDGVIIDPQVDFMDLLGSALPVAGAVADMQRLSTMIDRIGPKVRDFHVTLDSHHPIDVAHPGMWTNNKGESPAPFTLIRSDDIRSEIWFPRNRHAKLSQLGGQTLEQYMIGYTQALEAAGKYLLMIWPEHCLIGSGGHAVQADLFSALSRWEKANFANVDFVTKGVNPFTEHYGGLMAEVPLASDPSTGLNTGLLTVLQEADIVFIAGEALSHCVMTTVNQIADNIGEEHVRKFHILTDCSSPVPQPPGGPDFPAIAKDWLKTMKKRGMTLTTSTEFLA